MARLECPKCHNTDTWAQYVHDPCPGSPTGTRWEAPAESATPDGKPVPMPCPRDGTLTQASGVKCRTCGNTW